MAWQADYPGRQGRSPRQLEAIFADTEEWIRKLEDDAHWARSRELREASLERARTLTELLELAQRGLLPADPESHR